MLLSFFTLPIGLIRKKQTQSWNQSQSWSKRGQKIYQSRLQVEGHNSNFEGFTSINMYHIQISQVPISLANDGLLGGDNHFNDAKASANVDLSFSSKALKTRLMPREATEKLSTCFNIFSSCRPKCCGHAIQWCKS